MRTITTILYQDIPSGVKTIEFTNRLVKWIFLPRIEIKNVAQIKIDELSNTGIYFLLGENENWEEQVYIWQAVDLKTRLGQHNKGKDFWNRAILFTSKENSLTESDLNYLEKTLIKKTIEINRIKLENKTAGNPCLIPNHRKADMEDFLEDLEILLGNLWFPFLQEYNQKNPKKNNSANYYLQSRWSEAEGILTQEGFLILKGSIGPKGITLAWKRRWVDKKRENLINKWIIKIQGNDIIFLEDYLFTSPSTWATVIAGNPLNGWITWKNKNGKTLDEIERVS